MPITSTRWLSDYLVESELLLKPLAEKITYVHPEELFEIHLSNARSGEDGTGFLSVQVIVPAADIQTAERNTQTYLEKFLHLFSFITSTGYRISSRLHLTDWTPGQHQRQQYAYTRQTKSELFTELSAELLDTARMLESWGVTPVLERSLRWFSAAVRARIMDDQFQFFWFVIELVAEATKTTDRVPDRCPKCGSELYCNTCDEISTHRPFSTQAIRFLLESLNISSEIIECLFLIRNGLMHGETREVLEISIQKKIEKFTFDNAVDVIGKCAWTAILNTFEKPAGVHRPQFLHVSTFVDWHMSAKAHLVISIPGDVNDPKVEHVVLPTVSIVTSERSDPSGKPNDSSPA